MYHLLKVYPDVNLSSVLNLSSRIIRRAYLKAWLCVRLKQTEFLVEGKDILSIFNLHKVRLVGHEEL